jgi:transcriptional antiterminator NusG
MIERPDMTSNDLPDLERLNENRILVPRWYALYTENRLRVLNVPGAVRFVGLEGHADPIPEEQIQNVRRFLESSIAIDPYPYIQVGSRVEVIAGPLKGIQGILVKKRGRFRFVLQVDLIRQAVSVEIDASDVRPL